MRLLLKPVVSVVVLSALVWGMQLAPAHAEDTTPVPEAVESARADAGAPQAVSNDDVELPEDADEPAVLSVGESALEMSIPSSGEAEAVDDSTAVFSDGDASIAVQSTAEGMRALIHIDSADAPERYEFEMGGDVAALEPAPGGGVVALNADGEAIAIAPAPWAVDADGVDVPTHFEIEGTELIQVVEHRDGDFAYGIVADPWWNPFSWKWGKWVKKTTKTGSPAGCAENSTSRRGSGPILSRRSGGFAI